MTVSVLIPAYRPTYLAQTIASVLAQSFEDFELVVSDDSLGGEVESVVRRFSDPRLRYVRTEGGLGAAGNIAALWGEARHDYLQFVFDDDVLLPHALVTLVAEAQRKPGRSFYFANRYIIDALGRVIAHPRSVRDGKTLLMSKENFRSIAAKTRNNIGTFSNVLMNRAIGLDENDILHFHGFTVEMNFDVSFYLNASAKAPAMGVGRAVASSRRRARQEFERTPDPRFVKVRSEWELFVRGEYAAGGLTPDQTLATIDSLDRQYADWAPDWPELRPLQQALPGFRAKVEAGDQRVLDDEFRSNWSEVDRLMRDFRNLRPLEITRRRAPYRPTPPAALSAADGRIGAMGSSASGRSA